MLTDFYQDQEVQIRFDAWPGSDHALDILARGKTGRIKFCADDSYPFGINGGTMLWEVEVPGIGVVYPLTEELVILN